MVGRGADQLGRWASGPCAANAALVSNGGFARDGMGVFLGGKQSAPSSYTHLT